MEQTHSKLKSEKYFKKITSPLNENPMASQAEKWKNQRVMQTIWDTPKILTTGT